MGDRANIYLKQNGGKDAGIYLYTHGAGYRLPCVLQDALKRGRGRWDDEQYLSRIIFSEMIKDDIEGETGYGLSTYQGDGGYRILIVDSDSQTVGISASDESTIPVQTWSFEGYCNLDLGDPDDGAEPWRVLKG